jgi:hypothetical protein
MSPTPAVASPPPIPVGSRADERRLRRLGEIRAAVVRGTYVVHPGRVAGAMLSHASTLRPAGGLEGSLG